jgi:hypothetical protein
MDVEEEAVTLSMLGEAKEALQSQSLSYVDGYSGSHQQSGQSLHQKTSPKPGEEKRHHSGVAAFILPVYGVDHPKSVWRQQQQPLC